MKRLKVLFSITIPVLLVLLVLVNYQNLYRLHTAYYEDKHNSTILIKKKKGCENFIFDRAYRTIKIQSHFISKNESCNIALVSSLIKGDVKRIIYENGSIVNKGCTQRTLKCQTSGYYDEVNKIRINTPPCCLHKTRMVHEHLVLALNQLNISHMLVFGGVIGWMRNKKMVPYDGDLDVIIQHEFWDTSLFWQMLKTLGNEYGYHATMRDNGQKLWLHYSSTNINGLDIWPFYVRNNKVVVPHNVWVSPPVEIILPPKRVKFENVWTFVPRNPKAYLDLLYGKDSWLKELDCRTLVDGKCMPNKI